MEALAGQDTDIQLSRNRLFAVPEEPAVRLAAESGAEVEVQAEFDQWLGNVTVKNSLETAAASRVNILERLLAAKNGDPEALKSLTLNVDTAVFEGVFKEGYIGTVYMDRNGDDKVSQHGQDTDSIFGNGIIYRPNRHSILEDITEAEAFNRFWIERGLEEGTLKKNHHVTFSLVPGGVPEEQLGEEGDGYFTDSLALNIQDASETLGGRLKIETAFMRGVDASDDDTFEERIAKRYDFKAVSRLYEWFGKKPPQTAAGFIKNSLIIPNEMAPNGVADVMRWLDMAADEVLGRDIERSAEDYVGLRLESKRKEASLKEVRQKVLEGLLAKTDEFRTPMEAVKCMWKLVRRHALDNSVENHYIDPLVFGRQAAPDIIAARYYAQNGNLLMVHEFMRQADQKAVITGCGGGSSANEFADNLQGVENKIGGGEHSHGGGRDRYGSLKFKCQNGHENVRPKNKLIDKCKTCGVNVKC